MGQLGFARRLTARLYELSHQENLTDLTLHGRDGSVHTHSLTLLVAFPQLRELTG